MRAVLLVSFLAASALVPLQTSRVGIFTGSVDVGAPPLKGAAEYDAAAKQYTITGTGADIWARADQFHYVYREISGNFAVTATTKFLTDGNAHRKASIMVRKTTETDSPFVHFAIHGDGLFSLQFRTVKGDTTNTLDFPMATPGVFKLKLIRQGATFTVFIAKEAAPLRELGHTNYTITNPVLVGLAVASHSVDALNTVQFSDVSIEAL